MQDDLTLQWGIPKLRVNTNTAFYKKAAKMQKKIEQ